MFGGGAVGGEVSALEGGEKFFGGFETSLVVVERPTLLCTRTAGKSALVDASEEIEDTLKDDAGLGGDGGRVFTLGDVFAEKGNLGGWAFGEGETVFQ